MIKESKIKKPIGITSNNELRIMINELVNREFRKWHNIFESAFVEYYIDNYDENFKFEVENNYGFYLIDNTTIENKSIYPYFEESLYELVKEVSEIEKTSQSEILVKSIINYREKHYDPKYKLLGEYGVVFKRQLEIKLSEKLYKRIHKVAEKQMRTYSNIFESAFVEYYKENYDNDFSFLFENNRSINRKLKEIEDNETTIRVSINEFLMKYISIIAIKENKPKSEILRNAFIKYDKGNEAIEYNKLKSLNKINKHLKENNLTDYEVIEVDSLSKPITLRHSCGHTYEISNWQTFEQGNGRCPECRDGEKINKHLKENNLTDYEVIEVDALSKPITLRHSCGHTYEIHNWSVFKQGYGRCSECKKEEERKRRLNRINQYFKANNIEDYEVIEFDTLTNPITLKHSCGHTYEIYNWHLLKQGYGRCSKCRKEER